MKISKRCGCLVCNCRLCGSTFRWTKNLKLKKKRGLFFACAISCWRLWRACCCVLCVVVLLLMMHTEFHHAMNLGGIAFQRHHHYLVDSLGTRLDVLTHL